MGQVNYWHLIPEREILCWALVAMSKVRAVEERKGVVGPGHAKPRNVDFVLNMMGSQPLTGS